MIRHYIYRLNGQEIRYVSCGRLGSQENCEDLMRDGKRRYGRFFPINSFDDYKNLRSRYLFSVIVRDEEY